MQEVDRHRTIRKPTSEGAAKLFFKTQICPNYLRGQCFRGESCHYAHGEHELQHRPNLEKTKMCQTVDQGVPCLNPQCGFAHHPSELKHTNNLYKTSLCIEHSKGFCKKGDLCRYAHGQAELRTKEENQMGIQKSALQNNLYPKPVTQLQQPMGKPMMGMPMEHNPYMQFPPFQPQMNYPQFIPQGMPQQNMHQIPLNPMHNIPQMNFLPPGMFNPLQQQFMPQFQYSGMPMQPQTIVNNKQAEPHVF